MAHFRPFHRRVEFYDQKVSWVPFVEPDFFKLIAGVDPEAVSANPCVHYSNAFGSQIDAALWFLWVGSSDGGSGRFAFWGLRGDGLFRRLDFVA